MIDIKDKSKCCGCEACKNICPQKCITMKEDEEGFRYPVIDKERCIHCNLCDKIHFSVLSYTRVLALKRGPGSNLSHLLPDVWLQTVM